MLRGMSEVDPWSLPVGAFKRRAGKPAEAKGYAAKPGTGPEGETCKSCRHLRRHRMAKTYLKCALMAAHWTSGPGSDVRAGSPACVRWEEAD